MEAAPAALLPGVLQLPLQTSLEARPGVRATSDGYSCCRVAHSGQTARPAAGSAKNLKRGCNLVSPIISMEAWSVSTASSDASAASRALLPAISCTCTSRGVLIFFFLNVEFRILIVIQLHILYGRFFEFWDLGFFFY